MATRPNILVIMSDDHAAHAIGAYGSTINETPSLDRLATEGVRLDNCFCANAICAPSRATILTGTHSHINGVRTLRDEFDGRKETVQGRMHDAGYQTAIVGKWHLGHGGNADPTGFDYWEVLPDQGEYINPTFLTAAGKTEHPGYVTDIITDLSLSWLEQRDPERPFLLFLHHKAPHRPWTPDEKHAAMFANREIPLPETFADDYAGKADAARRAAMRIDDLQPWDYKLPVPEELSPDEARIWKYQRYMQDYLACVQSIDDNVGRVLTWLDDHDLADTTVVIYTSDQGFFLGDHGWFDKRFMYEESLRMPFLMRYPAEIAAGSVDDTMISNVDFAPFFLDLAGLPPTPTMQGRSFRSIVAGEPAPDDWREGIYYRYWMHNDPDHHVVAHYGVRTKRYKLIYYYGDPLDCTGSFGPPTTPEWEFFDLSDDSREMRNRYSDPAYAEVIAHLKRLLDEVQREAKDTPFIAAE